MASPAVGVDPDGLDAAADRQYEPGRELPAPFPTGEVAKNVEFEVPIEIDASQERVWEVLVDVEAWPEWTPSMKRVKRLEAGPFQMGSGARIWQPRMPSMIWRVTAMDEGRSFTWEASRPGTKVVACHELRPGSAGGTAVTLAIESSGLAVRLVAPLMASTMRRYLGLEAQGLKARAESSS